MKNSEHEEVGYIEALKILTPREIEVLEQVDKARPTGRSPLNLALPHPRSKLIVEIFVKN